MCVHVHTTHQLAMQASKEVRGMRILQYNKSSKNLSRGELMPSENILAFLPQMNHSVYLLTNILFSTLSPLVSSFTFFLTEILIFLPITSLALSEIKENTLIKHFYCQHEKETPQSCFQEDSQLCCSTACTHRTLMHT